MGPTTHLLVPQLPWMDRTPYTACLRPATSLQTTTLTGKIRCKECRRIQKAALADGEHPLYYFFHQPQDMVSVNQPEDIWEYVRRYTFQAREAFYCLYTDVKQNVLDLKVLATGSHCGVTITPMMIFKPAIAMCAQNVYLIHNHPTGDPLPSRNDLDVTIELIKAGTYLGLPVVDHVICTPSDYTSIRETHSYMF